VFEPTSVQSGPPLPKPYKSPSQLEDAPAAPAAPLSPTQADAPSGSPASSPGSASGSRTQAGSTDDPKVWLASLPTVAATKDAVQAADPGETALLRQAAFGILCDFIMNFNGGDNFTKSATVRYVDYHREYYDATRGLDRNPYFLSPKVRLVVIAKLISKEAARAYATTSSFQRVLAAASGTSAEANSDDRVVR
jgi:hypothetical protein